MIPRGRQFAYKITEGFATAPRVLWGGLFADIVVFSASTFLVFIVIHLVAKKLAKRKLQVY